MKKNNLFIIIVIVGILIPGILAIPQTLSLHGKLTNSTGSALSGTYNMTFKIYNSSIGGSSLWTDENQTITVDSDGIYNFILKDVNLTFEEQYYLGIAVESDSEMTPRINLTSAPYTFRAQNISAEGILNDSNMDLTGKNITASSGFFSWLGSLVNRITKLFVQDITFNGSINGSGNITTTGRIGIGTESPGYKLEIVDGSTIISMAYNKLNWDVISSLSIGSQEIGTGNIYLDYPSAGNLYIRKSGAVAFAVFDNQSRLGIGTSSPTHELNVVGNVNITGTSYFKNASFNGGWENDGVSISDGDIFAQTIYVYNITSLNVTKKNLTIIDNLTIGGHLFSSGTGNNYFLGNLGIGTGSPAHSLDVIGSIRTDAHLYLGNSINDYIIMGGGGAIASRGANRIQIGSVTSGISTQYLHSREQTGVYANLGGNDFVIAAGAGTGTGEGGSLFFGTAPAGVAGTTINPYVSRMTILTNGNVGIGTTAPSQKLDVRGQGNFSGTVYINNATDISLFNNTLGEGSFNSSGWNRSGTDVVLHHTGDSVGIGTTSPSQALEVDGYILADNFNATGELLTAVGVDAGKLNTGNWITAIGYQAGYSNVPSYLTAVGHSAGYNNTGNSLTAIGYSTGRLNTGNWVTVIGRQAGNENIGNASTGVGIGALENNTGNNVVVIGYNAGKNNIVSDQFIVKHALVNAMPLIQGNFSSGNVGIGTETPTQKLDVNGYILADNFNAIDGNTSVGVSAGSGNTGDQITTLGYDAGSGNTGGWITAIGWEAGKSNAQDDITVVGHSAGWTNTGSSLTALGRIAGYFNKGNFVVAIGASAGSYNEGSKLIAIGKSSAYESVGNELIAIGYYAGYQDKGNNSIGIGYEALRSNTGNDVVAIGDQAGEGNSVSNQFIVKQTRINAIPLIQGNFSSGNVGIGTASPQEKLHVQGTGAQRIEIETDDDNSPVLKITRNNSNSKGIYVDSNAALNFFDYDTATTQMIIGDDGNVGIGTESPNTALEVNGSVFLPSGGSYWIGNYSDSGDRLRMHQTGSNAYVDYATGNLYFRAGTTTKVTFNSSGNVGIGTTSPNQNLHVVGNVNITGNLTVGGLGQGVPAGAIMAFNSATCPVGWIPADGDNGTPDLRGLFVRGAGTSTSYTMANGTAFSAAFDTYQNDSFQGHRHNVRKSTDGSEIAGYDQAVSNAQAGAQYGIITTNAAGTIVRIGNPLADATHGTPRTSGETRPASYALTYCQKTTEDSGDSTTIWGVSGNDVVLNNASKNVNIDGTISDENGVVRTWHEVANPGLVWFASKIDGWTADSFTGGLEVDFSSAVPAGTKAVRVTVYITGAGTYSAFWRKFGDTNIANTPYVSGEYSHYIGAIPSAGGYWVAQCVMWLSDDYRAQIAVQHVGTDLHVSYPMSYYK